MAKYLTTDEELTAVADAIREAGGTSAPLEFPSEFISAIEDMAGRVDAESLSVAANGTYTAPAGKAYTPVTVNVPNSYAASDEGKVVSNGALVGQTAKSVSTNGTVDTTLNNSVTVNVPTGTARTSADLTASGATVNVPAGLYASAASKTVASGSAATPATTITADPTISVSSSGLITAAVSKTQSVTPTVSAGYVSSGTAGTITVGGSNTQQLTAKAAQTYTPTTTDQTIASGQYLTGAQTIKGDANLVAANIAKDVSIFGVTGTHEGGGGGGSEADDEVIAGTLSGSYENSRVTRIAPYKFYSMLSLTTVSFPAVTTIGAAAFNSCTSLTTVSFPAATTIGSSAFFNCSSLTTVSFPAATTIGTNAFHSCASLTTVSFPAVTTISNTAFGKCSSLTTVSFPAATTIGLYAFSNCTRFANLYLMGSSVATLTAANAFSGTLLSGTAATGSIFVPASLYSSYIATTNWTAYSSRFVSI